MWGRNRGTAGEVSSSLGGAAATCGREDTSIGRAVNSPQEMRLRKRKERLDAFAGDLRDFWAEVTSFASPARQGATTQRYQREGNDEKVTCQPAARVILRTLIRRCRGTPERISQGAMLRPATSLLRRRNRCEETRRCRQGPARARSFTLGLPLCHVERKEGSRLCSGVVNE